MKLVRTVLGDVDVIRLGRVNYHEHLFQVSPLLVGDELTDERASQAEARLLAASGFDAMVDATPVGLGRNPEALARISAATGLMVIGATGMHREAHYSSDHWLRSLGVQRRAELFLDDLLHGMPRRDGGQNGNWHRNRHGDRDGNRDGKRDGKRDGNRNGNRNGNRDGNRDGNRESERANGPDGSPVRAGLLKAGVGYWSITSFERETLEAVAIAQTATGAPVMVHLEFCTAAHEVLDLLGSIGVPADRVVLAHADRDPNPSLHLELTARGVWLGYDGMARPRTRSDAELLDLTEAVVSGGAIDHILIGGDVARSSRYIAYGGMPGLAYLGERYLPQLRARIGTGAVEGILTTNAQRFLAWTIPETLDR